MTTKTEKSGLQLRRLTPLKQNTHTHTQLLFQGSFFRVLISVSEWGRGSSHRCSVHSLVFPPPSSLLSPLVSPPRRRSPPARAPAAGSWCSRERARPRRSGTHFWTCGRAWRLSAWSPRSHWTCGSVAKHKRHHHNTDKCHHNTELNHRKLDMGRENTLSVSYKG